MANRQGHARDGGYTASMTDDELVSWCRGEMFEPSYGA
jgi:hypothetical protein